MTVASYHKSTSYHGFQKRKSPYDSDLGPLVDLRSDVKSLPLQRTVEPLLENKVDALVQISFPFYQKTSSRTYSFPPLPPLFALL